MILKKSVKTSFANIYREPRFSSEMVTQALFLETLNVKSEHNNWFKVSQWDGYEGYVHKFYLCDYVDSGKENTILTERLTPIYTSLDTCDIAMLAPFGTEVCSEQENDNWCSFMLESNRYYFQNKNSNNSQMTRENIIKNASLLVGSPYLWGGKTPFGYDCSGFIQQIFKSIKIFLKRDTSEQIKDDNFDSVNICDVKQADIVFFNFESKLVDHVGIFCGDNNVIHCSGNVKVQSLNDLQKNIVDVKSIESEIDG